jgi:hypothetical protein
MQLIFDHSQELPKLRLRVISMAVLLLAISGCANVQKSSRQSAVQPAPAAAVSKPSLPNIPLNPVAAAAAKQGVISCAARIQQVTQYLGYSPAAGVMLMTPQSQPDQKLLPMVMELPAGNRSAYVTASFAPNQANGCGATYDAVIWWPATCDIVARQQFPGMKILGKLRTNITVLDAGQSSKVSLMPAGNGCVSVKKEVVL